MEKEFEKFKLVRIIREVDYIDVPMYMFKNACEEGDLFQQSMENYIYENSRWGSDFISNDKESEYVYTNIL